MNPRLRTLSKLRSEVRGLFVCEVLTTEDAEVHRDSLSADYADYTDWGITWTGLTALTGWGIHGEAGGHSLNHQSLNLQSVVCISLRARRSPLLFVLVGWRLI